MVLSVSVFCSASHFNPEERLPSITKWEMCVKKISHGDILISIYIV